MDGPRSSASSPRAVAGRSSRTSTNKCVDLAGGATANGTLLVLNDCNGNKSQTWTVSPDVQSGAFSFKNAAAGRCMDEPHGNTGAGVQMWIWSCDATNQNQKFSVQAVDQ